MADFYLASHSARRRDLLRQIGARFEPLLVRVVPPRGPDISERILAGEAPVDYVRRVAKEKARSAWNTMRARNLVARPVLAADTVVIAAGSLVDQPLDAVQAAACVRRISDTTHEVRTAIALAVPGEFGHEILLTAESVTSVRFRALSDDEVRRYVETGEPLGKAGGYAIQGRAAMFVERIEGSYTGVVGLPLAETAALLAQAGVAVL